VSAIYLNILAKRKSFKLFYRAISLITSSILKEYQRLFLNQC